MPVGVHHCSGFPARPESRFVYDCLAAPIVEAGIEFRCLKITGADYPCVECRVAPRAGFARAGDISRAFTSPAHSSCSVTPRRIPKTPRFITLEGGRAQRKSTQANASGGTEAHGFPWFLNSRSPAARHPSVSKSAGLLVEGEPGRWDAGS